MPPAVPCSRAVLRTAPGCDTPRSDPRGAAPVASQWFTCVHCGQHRLENTRLAIDVKSRENDYRFVSRHMFYMYLHIHVSVYVYVHVTYKYIIQRYARSKMQAHGVAALEPPSPPQWVPGICRGSTKASEVRDLGPGFCLKRRQVIEQKKAKCLHICMCICI